MIVQRFLPRTLLGRTVLVLSVVVVLTQLATQLVFSQFVSGEYGRQLVRVGTNSIVSIALGLRALPPGARRAYADTIEEATGYQIDPVDRLPLTAAASGELSGRLLTVKQKLAERLGPGTAVFIETTGNSQRVWVRLPVQDQDWWVRFERNRFDRAFPLSAALLLAASVLLAVVIAWLAVRRINEPLRAVQRNILQLGRGGNPKPVALPDGPAEIRALAQAVNRMATELNQAEHERALLLAGVSHDLRTPLSRLRLAVEMLTADQSSDQFELVQDIEEIDRIIGQFLDFGRNPDAVPAVPGDLGDVARASAERSANRGHPIVTQLEDALEMPMRRPALDRLVNNLLENAWRYGATPIELHATRTSEGIRLAVLDRGPGVPEHERERLIQPFTRLDASRTGPSGAGLGLAIVDRIARSHNGKLSLHARPGGGLEVRVVFQPA